MGRDQFFNAEQVQTLCAGRMLTPDSSPAAIAHAAMDILADGRYRACAQQMAVAIDSDGGAAQAAAALETLRTRHRPHHRSAALARPR